MWSRKTTVGQRRRDGVSDAAVAGVVVFGRRRKRADPESGA
jgi:hypothetical protein